VVLLLAPLVALALLGPLLTGPAEIPAAAPSAAQLLPPGTRVTEIELVGGGFVRAKDVEVFENGMRVLAGQDWRDLGGLVAAAPPRSKRLWLGTDHQGRSVSARAAYGARTSLTVASLATLIAVILGSVLGMASALLPRGARWWLEVTTDGLLGLPRLLLLLMLGILLGGSVVGIALAIGLGSWMEVSRLVQAESRRLIGSDFFEAALTSGAGRSRLAARHLLPNLTPVLAVAAPLVATEAVIVEATLSYLGLPGAGTSATWGALVADGQRLLPNGWWMVLFPGLLLTLTAFTAYGLTRPWSRRPLRVSS